MNKVSFGGFSRHLSSLELPIVFVVVIMIIVLLMTYISKQDTPAVDQRRVTDMEEIAQALELYARAHGGMYPESLDVIVANGYLTHAMRDPETGVAYQYVLTGRADYSVCTTMTTGEHHCVYASSEHIAP